MRVPLLSFLHDNLSRSALTGQIAQLAIMPISAFVIVKVPARILMPTLVFAWGTAQACMSASTKCVWGNEMFTIGS